ncbi:hypothetical protein [Methanoregula sp.]|uniref:hypothetical protein n=1 Tax=Methanoregula sp. TaxID=2052170 RepID=UPI003C54F240
MADIRDVISFSRNEHLVREYYGLKMFYPVKLKINISLTNKRLIVYSAMKTLLNFEENNLYQQINIEDIRGLEIFRSKQYSVSGIIACLFLIFAGFILHNIDFSIFPFLGIGCICGGIAGVVFCLLFPKRLFVFQVKGVTQNLNVGEFINIIPILSVGPDLPKLIQELGALIIEIQESQP